MSSIIQVNNKCKEKGATAGVRPKTMAWLVIQSSNNPDAEDVEWESLYPEDVPDWVKGDECLAKMSAGSLVCSDPNNGRKWYRALHCEAPLQ